MKIKSLLLAVVLLGGMGISSCNEEEAPGVSCGTWTTEYASILLEVASAATAWSDSQTAQTCQSLVDSYTDAINAMQDFLDEDCIPAESKSAIETAITTWNSLKGALDCSSVGT